MSTNANADRTPASESVYARDTTARTIRPDDQDVVVPESAEVDGDGKKELEPEAGRGMIAAGTVGAAVGTLAGGPIGGVIGAAVGGVAGTVAGKAIHEAREGEDAKEADPPARA